MATEGLDIELLPAASGYQIGCITLDAPAALNSLTLPMIDAMAVSLQAWAQDPEVVAVVLKSASDKVFCAGGDVRKLYHAIRANQAAGEQVDTYPEDFFGREYRLDYLLYTYAKPVLCWGQGIVMGGGLGLFRAASHRVATETTRAAMPEITIGLFPDAGGTQLLATMPGKAGLFLGLTGVAMHGIDVVDLGVANYYIQHQLMSAVTAAMMAATWQGQPDQDKAVLDEILSSFVRQSAVAQRAASVMPYMDAIHDALADCQSYTEVITAVFELERRNDWFAKAVATLKMGCPVTAGIIVEQLARASALNLPERFQMEMVIAAQCARHPDFTEGVRALLIDKDKQPRWQHDDLLTLPAAKVNEHFQPPWSEHPLADLNAS